jgi:3-keto-5-aminohexanoate cleavage enzyme
MVSNKTRKIIIAVAPVGREVLPPSINPLTPEAVASEVIECCRAGAAMVHLHVRDSQGEQTEDIAAFSQTLDIIRESSDIIIQGSTGGLTTLSLEERCVSVTDPRVEVASLNMGSVNFGEDVYINRVPDIRYWAGRMTENRVVPELEIFEAGMVAESQMLIEEGTLKPPFYYNFALGAHWAAPADPRSLSYLTSLLPAGVPWSVVHDNMQDFALLATAIGLGASGVRVGFEDSVQYAPGKIAEKNVDLVAKIVSLVHRIGYEVAAPNEARYILGVIRR